MSDTATAVLNPLQQEVQKILSEVPQQIERYGYFSASTCNTNVYGWSVLKHSAMEWIQRNPPEGYAVTRAVNWEVTDWKIMQK